MSKKAQTLRHFFEVGHKVQLQPTTRLVGRSSFEGLHATITQIEMRPDPNFLDLPTEEDWEQYRRYRSIFFWVKLDNFPTQDEALKHMGIPLHYHELRPLSP